MCIGVRIRKARLAAGISQTRLAELMGVTRSACSQWELPEGGTAPRQSRLAEIARLLGVNYFWLVTGQVAQTGDGDADTMGREMVDPPTAPEARPLNREQKELISLYSQLSPQGRSALLMLLRSMIAPR